MDAAQFEACWYANIKRVVAYAERHVGRDAAYDIASATFLTAWRSWERVPPEPLAWLITVARGQIRNHRRTLRRRSNLEQRLKLLEESAFTGGLDTDASMSERSEALAALAAMPDFDREALLLVAWEGLTTEQAARVLGCQPGTLRMRLHRARARLDSAATSTAYGQEHAVSLLDDIRPRAEHVTDQRSRTMLDAVLASPRHQRKFRRRQAIGFGLCGVIVAGGAYSTAAATGIIPDIVAHRFQQIRGEQDGWPDPIDGERQIADLPLSDGMTARIWYADTTDGWCVIRDMTGTAKRPEDLPVTCRRWGYPAEISDPRRVVNWQISPDGPAVIYGDFKGVTANVGQVRVTGSTWARTFQVKGKQFAAEVPAGRNGDRLRFSYVDTTGHEIASQVSTVHIESE